MRSDVHDDHVVTAHHQQDPGRRDHELKGEERETSVPCTTRWFAGDRRGSQGGSAVVLRHTSAAHRER